MSSRVSATPLVIDLRSSRWLAVYLCATYASAAGALMSLPIAGLYQGIALAALAGIGIVSWRTHILRCTRRAIIRMVWQADGSWSLEQRDGSCIAARLLPSSFLHPVLMVLNFTHSKWRHRHVVLMPDAADAAQLRRLRVRLRLSRWAARPATHDTHTPA